jgi:hypothetical protein
VENGTERDLFEFQNTARGNLVVQTEDGSASQDRRYRYRELSTAEAQVIWERKLFHAESCNGVGAMDYFVAIVDPASSAPAGERPCMWRKLSGAEVELIVHPKNIWSLDDSERGDAALGNANHENGWWVGQPRPSD